MRPEYVWFRALDYRQHRGGALGTKAAARLGRQVRDHYRSVLETAARAAGLDYENGRVYCPEGTPGARQFTNILGVGCGVANAAQRISEGVRKKPKPKEGPDIAGRVSRGERTVVRVGEGDVVARGKVSRRKGRGLSIPLGVLVEDVGASNNKPSLALSDDGFEALFAWMRANNQDLLTPKRGHSVGIDIRYDPEKKRLFVDVVDILDDEGAEGLVNAPDYDEPDEPLIVAESARDVVKRANALRPDMGPVPTPRSSSGIKVSKTANIQRGLRGQDRLDLDAMSDEEKGTLLNGLIALKIPGMKSVLYKDKNHKVLVEDPLRAAIQYMADNLMAIHEHVKALDPTLQRRAQWWYRIASTYDLSIASDIERPEEIVHAGMALFSASKDWEQNVAVVEHGFRLLKRDPVITPAMAKMIFEYRIKQNKKEDGTLGPRAFDAAMADFRRKVAAARESLAKERGRLTRAGGAGESAATIDALEHRVRQFETDVIAAERLMERAGAVASPEDLIGKRLTQVDDLHAGWAIRAHADTIGGRWMRQRGLKGTTRLASTAFDIDPDTGEFVPRVAFNAGGAPKIATGGTAQQYMTLVSLYRDGSEGGVIDWDIIDSAIGSQNKVRSFFWNLYLPKESHHRNVTADTHMGAGAIGIPIGGTTKMMKGLLFGGTGGGGFTSVYPLIREAVLETGRRLSKEREWEGIDLLPNEVQSILWEDVRRYLPVTYKSALSPLFGALWTRVEERELSWDQAWNTLFALAEAARSGNRERMIILAAQWGLPRPVFRGGKKED